MSHKKVSKQMEEQLDAVNRRVESALCVTDRLNELLEHRAGVLSLLVCNMEKESESSASWYATWRRSFCPTTGARIRDVGC